MKIGKLSNHQLSELIFKNLGKRRTEVLRYPELGEDVSYLDFDRDLIVMSTDPITGATKNLGHLAVHVACNDIAAGAGEPVAIMLTVMAPKDITEKDLETIVIDAERAAREINIDIIGGHTEITDAVNRIIISGTAIGRGRRTLPGISEGDAIVITKKVALEGTSIIAAEKPEMTEVLTADELKTAIGMSSKISVVPESRIAARHDITSMHDITEGGLLGALFEMSESKKLGFEINGERIPVHEVTGKICVHYGINPLRLISSGSMIITCPEHELSALLSSFEEEDMEATHIGYFRNISEGRVLLGGEGRINVTSEPSDHLYKVI